MKEEKCLLHKLFAYEQEAWELGAMRRRNETINNVMFIYFLIFIFHAGHLY